jgi:signal transduction histidine kinase
MSGIGISVYYDIIRRYGGQIAIESSPNERSTVTLVLTAKQII